MKSRGKEFHAEVVKEDGEHRLKVSAIKDKTFRSLSSAASAVTGLTGKQIPMRGGVAWGLIPQPNYAALAGATPAPPKPKAAKSKRSTKRSKNATRKEAK